MDKKTDYNYTIETMSTTDTDDVMKLLRRTFYLDEPMNKAVNLFEEGIDSCPELDEYCTGCIKEGLSLKAIDKDGKIVSVLISGELPLINRDDMLIQAQQCKNPKFQKILYVLAAREAGAKLWEKYPQEKTLAEGKVAATEPSWRRKGIMNKLLARTESIVKQRGLRLLRVDTSSEYSAKSAERNGFTCVYQSLYSDIKLNGKTILLPEPPHLYDRVYIKDLKPESVSPGSELDQASRNKS